jgi:hypothetical protein
MSHHPVATWRVGSFGASQARYPPRSLSHYPVSAIALRPLPYDNLQRGAQGLTGLPPRGDGAVRGVPLAWRFAAGFCIPGGVMRKVALRTRVATFRRNQLVPVPSVADLDASTRFLLTAGCTHAVHRYIFVKGRRTDRRRARGLPRLFAWLSETKMPGVRWVRFWANTSMRILNDVGLVYLSRVASPMALVGEGIGRRRIPNLRPVRAMRLWPEIQKPV